MTKLFPRTRKQTVGLVTVALLLAAGAAIAAPTETKGQHGAGASTDQSKEPRGHGPGKGAGRFDPFARWDQDKDGKITLKELPAKPQAHLATIDANKDGILTREEFDKGREQLRSLRKKEFDTNKDGKVTREERQAVMRAHFAERFAEDDKNKDGFLTQTEIPQRWDHVKVADANNDSKLSLDELKAAFESGKLGPRGRAGHQGRGNHGEGHCRKGAGR